MDYILQANGLCKEYRHAKALDGLSLRVPKGSIYGLVGKNGAGKTTLIRILCGLQQPTAGSFSLYGAGWGEPGFARARRRMGALVETPALYPGMTARQNLALQNRVLGLPDDENIPALLRLTGLEGTGRKRCGTFLWGCGSAWALPWRCAVRPTCWCWTSPPTAWIPRASSTCGN